MRRRQALKIMRHFGSDWRDRKRSWRWLTIKTAMEIKFRVYRRDKRRGARESAWRLSGRRS